MRTVNQLPLAPRDRKAIEQAAAELALPAREWTEGPYIVLPIHDEIDRDGVFV
jgi:hypothetical protein